MLVHIVTGNVEKAFMQNEAGNILTLSRLGLGEQPVIEGQERNSLSTVPPPFFAVPSWWRRFIFRLLTPRDLAVYVYICSLLGPKATAFPTYEQIAYELGLTTTEPIVASVRRLEKFGFIMRVLRRLHGRKTATRRTIYQRPTAEFTLLTLLKGGFIDGNLFPKGKQNELVIDELDTTASAVLTGLRNLLRQSRFETYINSTDERRTLVLQTLLQASLQERTGHTYLQLVDALRNVTAADDVSKPSLSEDSAT